MYHKMKYKRFVACAKVVIISMPSMNFIIKKTFLTQFVNLLVSSVKNRLRLQSEYIGF